MKILMLINPSSRGGRGMKKLPQLRKLLEKENIEAEEILLSSIDEAFERAGNLDTSLYDAVVAAGGDGTIRAVGAGVLAHVDPQVRMGVLYTGTSPDFCRFHNIPLDMREAVKTLKKSHTKSVPVLTVNGEPFFCSCNPGMGAEIAEKANRYRQAAGDFWGTLYAVVSTLWKTPRYDFRVNGELYEKCNHLLITRMPYIAGGLKLALPPLKEDEFVLWSLRVPSRRHFLKVLAALYFKRPCGKVQIISKGTLHIDTPGSTAFLEYDGDPHGTLPATIGFAPRKLNLIVPEGDAAP